MKKIALALLLLAAGTAPELNAQTTVFDYGAVWKYLDDGSDQGATAWKDSTYNDAAWASGPGRLGYSNNAVTVVSFGPNAADKYKAIYYDGGHKFDKAMQSDAFAWFDKWLK